MRSTLEQIIEPIMSQIEKLIGNPTAESLEKIRKQLKTTVLVDVSELRRQYGQLIKAYYETHKPFSHYSNSQNTEENFSKDIEDFIELVSYSAEAADISILDEWAIDYPCKNRQVLSKDLSAYVESLKRTVVDWDGIMSDLQDKNQPKWPDETKPYWAYLVNKLSSQLF